MPEEEAAAAAGHCSRGSSTRRWSTSRATTTARRALSSSSPTPVSSSPAPSYIGCANSHSSENSEPCDVKVAAKKRKVCSEISEIENSVNSITNGKGNASESTGSIGEDFSSPHSNTSENVVRTSNLSLVKLSRSGLLFFSFASGGLHVVQMLTEMFHSLRSGKLKSPQWCHRIFPIQETCVLSETELHASVSKLFLDFLRSKKDQDEPIKFAVGYNRRGIDETEMKVQKNDNEGSNQQALMDREQCFKVAAAAVKSVAEKSIVDLRSPEHDYFWMLHMCQATISLCPGGSTSGDAPSFWGTPWIFGGGGVRSPS